MATIKIRIAVAVDSLGSWNAGGYGGPAFEAGEEEAERALDVAISGLESADCQSVVWVSVEIPIPSQIEVEGEIEDTGLAFERGYEGDV